MQRKLAEDQEELERARKAVEKNKADQERKRKEAIVRMQANLAENRKYISQKEEASRLQAEKDEAMMKVGIDGLWFLRISKCIGFNGACCEMGKKCF